MIKTRILVQMATVTGEGKDSCKLLTGTHYRLDEQLLQDGSSLVTIRLIDERNKVDVPEHVRTSLPRVEDVRNTLSGLQPPARSEAERNVVSMLRRALESYIADLLNAATIPEYVGEFPTRKDLPTMKMIEAAQSQALQEQVDLDVHVACSPEAIDEVLQDEENNLEEK